MTENTRAMAENARGARISTLSSAIGDGRSVKCPICDDGFMSARNKGAYGGTCVECDRCFTMLRMRPRFAAVCIAAVEADREQEGE